MTITKQPIPLSGDFNEIINQLEHTRDNLFITGRAGTGKSTLLQLFRNTTRKRCVVLAPTGIAALNVKGQTIHSFFGFPPKMLDIRELGKRKNHRLYKKVDVIIIDEISMVRADMMDNIDVFLRNNREINLPFGGVQMVFFGDLFQLPPVVASDFERNIFATRYKSPYFFSSRIVNSYNMKLTDPFELQMIELNQVYRQVDRRFVNLLDCIRLNQMDYDELDELNQRYEPLPEDQDYFITLSSRNNIADQINQIKINELDTEPFSFSANVTGQFNNRLFPTDPMLRLKRGAQVMFVKNDPQKRFVNGSIGVITHLEAERIMIKVPDPDGKEQSIELEQMEWEILKYKSDPDKPKNISTEVVGTFKQYPIKLAWAITIHKSQGKTFDNVIIDMGAGAFEYGQTYVALSRCRTFEGVYLKRPIKPKDIMVDRRVSEWYEWKRYHS